jgi:phage internal scaffolding protein
MFKPIKYRGHNAYDTEEASNEATLDKSQYGESLTVQSHTEDSDINVIVARALRTGTMPQAAVLPAYGDYENVFDYRSALHQVMDAQNQFMLLPAKTRARFNNDPQELLRFVSEPGHEAELVALGLSEPKNPPSSPPVAKDGEPPKGGAT